MIHKLRYALNNQWKNREERYRTVAGGRWKGKRWRAKKRKYLIKARMLCATASPSRQEVRISAGAKVRLMCFLRALELAANSHTHTTSYMHKSTHIRVCLLLVALRCRDCFPHNSNNLNARVSGAHPLGDWVSSHIVPTNEMLAAVNIDKPTYWRGNCHMG